MFKIKSEKDKMSKLVKSRNSSSNLNDDEHRRRKKIRSFLDYCTSSHVFDHFYNIFYHLYDFMISSSSVLFFFVLIEAIEHH